MMDSDAPATPIQSYEDNHSSSIDVVPSTLSVMSPNESYSTPTDTQVLMDESITKIPQLQSSSSSRESSLSDSTKPDQTSLNRGRTLQRSRSEQFGCSTSRGILRTASYNNSPAPSSPSITFAPLPSIENRKRKSNVTLGIGARSRILAQRRAMKMQQLDDLDTPPRSIWSDPDGDEVVDEEDPLVVFGQFAKRATKSLWRKISLKDLKGIKDKDAIVEEVPPVPSVPGRRVIDVNRDPVNEDVPEKVQEKSEV